MVKSGKKSQKFLSFLRPHSGRIYMLESGGSLWDDASSDSLLIDQEIQIAREPLARIGCHD